jgi:hypothetical protein
MGFRLGARRRSRVRRRLIDVTRALEELKAAASAAQAKAAAAFDRSQRREQAAAGVTTEHLGKGVGSQLALARRESPSKGGRLLGFARALVNEMPHTLAALEAGKLSEWRATLLVRETACLSVEDRRHVDEALAAGWEALEGLGDRKLVAEAKRLAYGLDPHVVAARAAKAEADRHVSCRPAPDTMVWVSTLLPVAQGVTVRAVLEREADRIRSQGDGRSRGQIMADTLFSRVTGQSTQDPARIEIQLVMTDRTLFQGDSEPAELAGYGIVPAQLARSLIRGRGSDMAEGGAGAESAGQVWLRRLYTSPGTGELIGVDSRARLLPRGLRRLIQTRDRTCRTPWCGAPIRHHDHVVAWNTGGGTTAANSQGLCEHCNLAKEAPGWYAEPASGIRHTVQTSTPTGHTYRSTAPPLPGSPLGRPGLSGSPAPAARPSGTALSIHPPRSRTLRAEHCHAVPGNSVAEVGLAGCATRGPADFIHGPPRAARRAC